MVGSRGEGRARDWAERVVEVRRRVEGAREVGRERGEAGEGLPSVGFALRRLKAGTRRCSATLGFLAPRLGLLAHGKGIKGIS